MAPSAHVVVDLGFGDSGKGKIVDYLTHEFGSHLVVRFNGGAQAAHNVVTPDGRHHTFAQWGSGTLVDLGVRTLLTADVAIHPIAMQAEAEHLEAVGVPDPWARLIVSEDCLVTTPFHQALNCLREASRGDARHGSCGVGFGETVGMALHGLALRAGELLDRDRLAYVLNAIRLTALGEARSWGAAIFVEGDDLAVRWMALLSDASSVTRTVDLFLDVGRRLRIVNEAGVGAILNCEKEPVIFEGAQGVLIDEFFGAPPFHTWSTTTGRNAMKYRHLFEQVTVMGVVRAYPTRHGAGPFPTESAWLSEVLADPHNPTNRWQGAIRTGWFDRKLANYAISACHAHGAPIDELAVTHLDAVAKVGHWAHDGGEAGLSSGEAVDAIAFWTGIPVGIRSFGPTRAETNWKQNGDHILNGRIVIGGIPIAPVMKSIGYLSEDRDPELFWAVQEHLLDREPRRPVVAMPTTCTELQGVRAKPMEDPNAKT